MAVGGLPYSILQSNSVSVPITYTPVSNGLVAWFSALDFSSVTLAANAVSTWTNKAGGNSVSQSNASSRPVYAASSLNGRPGLSFSLLQNLSTSAFAVNAFSLFALYVPTGTQNNTYTVSNGVNTVTGFAITDRANGTAFFGMVFAGVQFAVSTIAYTTNSPILFTATRTSAGLTTIRINGSQGFSGTRGMNAITGSFAIGEPGKFAGSIHEVLLYNRDLSSAEIIDNETAIRTAYGIV